MTSQSHQEYIITLSELKRANAFMFTNKLKELSARPAHPGAQMIPCPYQSCEGCPRNPHPAETQEDAIISRCMDFIAVRFGYYYSWGEV